MKKFLKIFVVAIMAFALTGCIKMNVNVEIKEDLSMDAEIEMLFSDELLNSAGMTVDQLVAQMEDEMNAEAALSNAKTSPISKTIDGASYSGVSVTGFAPTENLGMSEYLKKETVDGTERIVLTLPVEMFNDADMMDVDSVGYSVSQMKTLGVEMNMNIKMPGKVTSTAGTVNGDTVTIDLLELMTTGANEDIVITSTPSSGSNMLLIVAGIIAAVAVIAVIAFVVMKKKNNKEPETVEMASVPVEEPTIEEPVAEEVAVEEIKTEEPAVEEPVVEETQETEESPEDQ